MPLPSAILRRHWPAIAGAAALTVGAAVAALADTGGPRSVVSVGGAVTEIVYALGEESRLKAVDTTSYYPAQAAGLPKVGYYRALSAEGLLSTEPDLVLLQDGSGPPDALAVLKASGIPIADVPDETSPEGIAAKISRVGEALGAQDRADALAADVTARFRALATDVGRITERKRVLFVLSLANGRATVGGAGTSADAMIRLAGGINAAADVDGFKPIVDEAVLAAAPDVVLVMERPGARISADEVFGLPAFQGTPAAADRALVSLDALYLLGFGPRTPAAARDLAAALYPGAVAAAATP
ncbi:heme/hemin ABC transporter substrate-binding protein [Chthonobacter rhizosphaerae]|uniref:heme/hemin ABC transporter substrate-binding protein n=1 Tax=Chthonobacter rhizosphaerae TaxID=2735553 RepID=UPI0015EF3A67|nr:ABC transporter substrate-binding protein [Chthonobacter rhizosphaerae]